MKVQVKHMGQSTGISTTLAKSDITLGKTRLKKSAVIN